MANTLPLIALSLSRCMNEPLRWSKSFERKSRTQHRRTRFSNLDERILIKEESRRRLGRYGGSFEDAAQVIGRSGDGGIDGTIKEDKLGLDVIYIQAKRWEATVGRPIVQAFAGSMEGFRARKGVLITTSIFSKEAEDYITRIERKIVLVDGQRMAELMIAHNVGVTVSRAYEIKRIDSDFFMEDE